MWDRIGTGLESAFAKTAGADHEFFIQQVLEHLKSSPSKAASSEDVAAVVYTLGEWNETDRQAWITYFHTHLIPVMVHAKSMWGGIKEERKAKSKSRNAVNPEETKSFLPAEVDQ